MAGEFRPSQVKLRYGKCPHQWRGATTVDRYPGVAGLDNVDLTAAVGRILRGGTISGALVEPASLPGPIATSEMPFVLPWANSPFWLGILGNLFGGAATAVQQGSANVWLHDFDALQTAVPLLEPLSFELDTSGDLIRRYVFSRVKSIQWEFAKGAPVAGTVTLNCLGLTYFGPGNVTTGTGQAPELFGILADAYDQLGTGDARKISMQCSAVAPGPPIELTVAFAIGATPTFGALTQTLIEGLSPGEQYPQKIQAKDSNTTAPGDTFGEQGLPVHAWLIDGTNWASLDTVEWPYGINAWTPVVASEPEIVTQEVCVSIDGEEVSAPETLTIQVMNDYNNVEPGFCGAFSNNFFREDTVNVEAAFARRWLTDRHQRKILLGQPLDLVVTARSKVKVDPGSHTQRYETIWRIPEATFDDGVTLKSFSGGATDSEESFGLRGAPSATIGGANLRVSAYTGFSAL